VSGVSPPPAGTPPLLYVRAGGRLEAAPAADQEVARSYPAWPDKGLAAHGRRVTILTARGNVRPGETVRVSHVAEATEPAARLYMMGPKAVLGEEVDGAPGTALPPEDGDPLAPDGLYDGPVVPGPALDYGWEVTSYRFDTRGPHRIVWRPGADLVSNTLVVEVD